MSPTSWLTAHEGLLQGGVALDVACGRGRHALWLAERGFEVYAIDRDPAALVHLDEEARRRGVRVVTEQKDLETECVRLGENRFDLVVAVHYLHRPLFRHLTAALRPGGLLVYETFTAAQATKGKPTNPAFLLMPGELRELVQPLEIVVEREGEFDDRCVASVIARKVN
jgi:2-polyprenyl-3-methyl-5-hydroxy-6-metoxy-1,4-benzoquinol methylase